MTAALEKTSSDASEAPTHKSVERWLNEWLRIELSDGRAITGRLMCTDNAPNVVLLDGEELWMAQEAEATKACATGVKRNVGMVMIPGKHILKVYHIPSS